VAGEAYNERPTAAGAFLHTPSARRIDPPFTGEARHGRIAGAAPVSAMNVDSNGDERLPGASGVGKFFEGLRAQVSHPSIPPFICIVPGAPSALGRKSGMAVAAIAIAAVERGVWRAVAGSPGDRR